MGALMSCRVCQRCTWALMLKSPRPQLTTPVLGNKRCWANCDVVEQKARLPEVKLDGRKLRSHFNEVVGVKDEESDDEEIQLVEPTAVEETPTEVVEVFRSW